MHTSTSAVIGNGGCDTALHAKRRGRLANNVSLDDEGNVKLISNKRKQKQANSKSIKQTKKGGDDGASISPLLAEWAKEDDSTRVTSPSKSTAVTSAPASSVFIPFDDEDDDIGSNGKRKKKKSKNNDENKSTQRVITSQMNDLLEGIADMLETTNCDVSELVSSIAALVELQSKRTNDQVLLPTLKSILSARPTGREGDKQPSYRLAWVGSDEAICHIGTSLHKVPLARLQEMYVLLGYNKWELLEVIRILGPFPNVRNTLKGELRLSKLRGDELGGRREGVRMEITYNSMIDGAGKEILAGKEDNKKDVNLNVWFANDRAIVCTVPKDGEEESGGSADPLTGSGEGVLLFVKEDDLDGSLEKLRAA